MHDGTEIKLTERKRRQIKTDLKKKMVNSAQKTVRNWTEAPGKQRKAKWQTYKRDAKRAAHDESGKRNKRDGLVERNTATN